MHFQFLYSHDFCIIFYFVFYFDVDINLINSMNHPSGKYYTLFDCDKIYTRSKSQCSQEEIVFKNVISLTSGIFC